MIDRIRHSRVNTGLLLVLGLLSVSACTEQANQVTVQNDAATVSFSAPARIAEARAIVQENLRLQITIGEAVDVIAPDANGQYVFRTVLPANSTFDITIEWLELIGEVDLLLASATKPLKVGDASSSNTIIFRDNELFTNHDLDGDEFSNLVERRDGTDFNDPNDPDQPPVLVTFNVQANLPEQLDDAADDIKDEIFLEVGVDGIALPLSRDEQQWTGTTMVTQDSEPQVDLKFYLTSQRSLKLAELLRSQNAGQGATAIFEADAYEVDSFDDDNDGFSNIVEIANGTNPRDSADPPPDSDGDGIPNAADNCVDTSNNDQSDIDGDGIGDACDSVNDLDLDGDDVDNDDDNCPDDPNTDQEDTDMDGIGDACDTNNGLDSDGDGILNDADNCPSTPNDDQADIDNDGRGDACDPVNDDPDGDLVNNPEDNCPNTPNNDQQDTDLDGIGDACEIAVDDQ